MGKVGRNINGNECEGGGISSPEELGRNEIFWDKIGRNEKKK